MRHVFFLLVFVLMSAGDLAWWRWADVRLRRLPRPQLPRLLLRAFVLSLLLYLVALFLLPAATRRSDGPIPMPLHAAAFLWHLLVLPASLMVALFTSVGSVISRALRKRPKPPGRPADGATALSRRELLGAAGVALPPLILAGTTGAAMGQLARVQVRRFDVGVPGLPPPLDGLTIAHVSDLHVGKFTRDGSLNALADRVNAMKSDFVAVTGDLIDLSLADLPRALAMVRRLDPRHGLYICEGNHDLIEDPIAFETRMNGFERPFLLESGRTVEFRGEAVQFLGIRWAHADAELAASVSRVAALRREGAFPILLAHHPHAFDAAAAAGFPLTLSGHTHGGQLMLNEQLGFGPAMFRYWSGLYRARASSLVVSNGAGNWFPLRVNAPADIVHLTLRRAAATV